MDTSVRFDAGVERKRTRLRDLQRAFGKGNGIVLYYGGDPGTDQGKPYAAAYDNVDFSAYARKGKGRSVRCFSSYSHYMVMVIN